MIRFSFWFVRFMCLVGFAVSVTFINIHNFSSAIFHIFGLFAAINLYIQGIFQHETLGIYVKGDDIPAGKRSIPSVWILFRVFQLLIWLVTSPVHWLHLVVYVSFDIAFFALLFWDQRYEFMLVPEGSKTRKTLVEEE